MSDAGKIITLDEGWDKQIKINAVDVLEDILEGNIKKRGKTTNLFTNNSYIAVYT